MPSTRRILLALTSHGLGHLTRSLAIARALRDRDPGVEWTVATTVPRERVALDLPPPFAYRSVAWEPGTLQKSCFELDVEGTRHAYDRYLEERPERLRAEQRWLDAARIDAVVVDVPALPVRAAAACGLPVVGVANFTWDWILAPLLGEQAPAVRVIAEDYAKGSALLRLPFGPEDAPFPVVEAGPLVARRARIDPAEVRHRLGLPREEERALVVVCPGGWEAEAWEPIHVPDADGLRFVTVGDLPIASHAPLLSLPHALPDGISFPDLVAAADAVVAKPGYGIASECALHATALVSIERPGFRETPVLEAQFEAYGPLARLSLADFFAGRWREALAAVLPGGAGARPFRPVPPDGADRVAEWLELAL